MTAEPCPELLEELRREGAGSGDPVTLHVTRGDPASDLGRRLAESAAMVERCTGGLIPAFVEEIGGSSQIPTLSVRVGGREVVRYHAAPEGPELRPFQEGLLACVRGAGLAALDRPGQPVTELTVFIAATCPNCPVAVGSAIALAVSDMRITVSVVDVAELPERAERTGIRSVPTIVADGGLTVVGAVSAAELADRLAKLAGPESETALLDSLLDAGRFAAAGELLAAGAARERFLDRWQHGGMEGRIGLVLAADEALLRSAGALDSIVPDLMKLTASEDRARRGDTADLLGRIGHPSARSLLEALAEDADEEIAEAAADALTELDERDRRVEPCAGTATGDGHISGRGRGSD